MYFAPADVFISLNLYRMLVPRIMGDLETAQPKVILDCMGSDTPRLFDETQTHLPASAPAAEWASAPWRQRRARLALHYQLAFTDTDTACLAYARR